MSDNKSENHDEKLIEGHVYDDIRELDNPLPNWWLITFFGTIIFSAIYFIHYQFGTGSSSDQELQSDMATITSQRTTGGQSPASSTVEDLMALVGKPEVITEGKGIYTTRCQACHGPAAGGLVGPNLTDKYWILGKGTMMDLVKVVTEGGRPNKGMQAWNTMLTPEQIHAVAAFVYTLRNTNVAGGKAPEGDPVEEMTP